MIVKEFGESYEFIEYVRERFKKGIPLPVKLIIVKLKEDENKAHYLHILELGIDETYFIDSGTDYSGTGGRIKRQMDQFFDEIEKMITIPEMVIRKEYEMPWELYWRLKVMFHDLYTKEEVTIP